ncbi:MAG: DUF2752 domain-containing protein [Kofleriaceae bacterium]
MGRGGDLAARAAAALWIACMTAGLAVGAFGSAALRASVTSDGPGCPFRAATTLPCAFCGMTHATVALGHGDVREAFAYHPLAPVVLLLMFAVCGAIVVGRSPALTRGPRPYLILAVIAVIWIANLAA